jgi:hypothetical protein
MIGDYKIKELTVNTDGTFAVTINRKRYIGSYSLCCGFVSIDYMRNICSNIQAHLRMKTAVMFLIEKVHN